MTASRPGSAGKGHDFLRAITGFAEANGTTSSADKPIKMGRVDYDYNPADFLGGVYPRVLFDGESTVSQKRYPTLVGYYPLPGQRVVLVPIGTTYMIIGTVDVAAPQDPDVQIFTTSDTWEKPAGARYVRVQCQGGGAGGGGTPSGSTGSASAGGGGGGGAYAESYLSANTVSSSVTVTVGTGGAGGVAGANAGTGGVASSFGSYVSANGGGGGSAGFTRTTGSNVSTGGVGGSGGTGDLVVIGGDGGNGMIVTAICIATAWGGNSFLAGIRRGSGFVTGSGGGTTGKLYGGGGGGAVSGNAGTTAQPGGDGADGIVIVTTYF